MNELMKERKKRRRIKEVKVRVGRFIQWKAWWEKKIRGRKKEAIERSKKRIKERRRERSFCSENLEVNFSKKKRNL